MKVKEPKENSQSNGKPIKVCSTCGGADCVCSGLQPSSKMK